MNESAQPARARCSVYIAVSLDGYIARKDDSLDWLEVVQAEGEDYGYKEFMASVDALVIGRRTYDKVLEFDRWPYDGKRCVVLTHRAIEVGHGEERFDGDQAELLRRLGAEGVRRVYLDGGGAIRSFLARDLVDDLTLSFIPLLLGDGMPLFGSGGMERLLELEESRAFPSGLVQVRYRRSR
jgi:dihydrofolate reductase